MRKFQLDGLRFILFLLVFATHYSSNPLSLGYLGYALPVFFVMSGFLITNVLLSAEDSSLITRLRIFYIRRILRICPAYYLVVVLLIAMDSLSYPNHKIIGGQPNDEKISARRPQVYFIPVGLRDTLFE